MGELQFKVNYVEDGRPTQKGILLVALGCKQHALVARSKFVFGMFQCESRWHQSNSLQSSPDMPPIAGLSVTQVCLFRGPAGWF